MPKIVNLTGQTFGKLFVYKQSSKSGAGGKRWVCRCDCGGTTVAYGFNLQRGLVRSCGCSKAKGTRSTHGLSGTKVHHVWRTMLDRCNNPNANQYEDYGGRGIVVCTEWHEFTKFFADMGYPPQGGTLDRLENDGPYCKENCKWSTRKEQSRNKRNNRMLTVFGKTQTVTDWAIEYGMPPRTLFNRLIRSGMDPETALTAPLHAKQKGLV